MRLVEDALSQKLTDSKTDSTTDSTTDDGSDTLRAALEHTRELVKESVRNSKGSDRVSMVGHMTQVGERWALLVPEEEGDQPVVLQLELPMLMHREWNALISEVNEVGLS